MTEQSPIPPFLGGQGRSAESVRETGQVMVVLGIAALLLLVATLAVRCA